MHQELTLKALATFAAVARTGSVTGASAQLGIAQSAISRQLGELEKLLGGALFYRTGRGLTPTALAGQVLEQAAPILSGAQQLVESARGVAGIISGTVTIGLVPAVSAALASALFAAVDARYPAVRLRVTEGYSGEIETRLSQGDIDFGVLNRYRALGRNSYRRLFDTPLMLVGRRDALQARLAVRGRLPASLALRDIAGFPLVLPVPPNAIRGLLDALCQRQGVDLSVSMEAGSSVLIKRMVLDHAAFSVLPYHAIAAELDTGLFGAVPFGERALRQTVVLATGSQRPFTLASRRVAQLVPEIAESLLRDGTWRR